MRASPSSGFAFRPHKSAASGKAVYETIAFSTFPTFCASSAVRSRG